MARPWCARTYVASPRPGVRRVWMWPTTKMAVSGRSSDAKLRCAGKPHIAFTAMAIRDVPKVAWVTH